MPSCFISYSWDSDTHKQWVRDFTILLRDKEVDAELDQLHLKPGDQLAQFMEQAISRNDYVLIICTPNYKMKSDERKGGVGYEGNIMTSELLNHGNQRKFIPILRAGDGYNAIPKWLEGKLYIDLRGDPFNESNLGDLLATLHNIYIIPPIGKYTPESINKPNSVSANTKKVPMISNDTAQETTFMPVNIQGIITADVTTPRNDGTRGSALYAIPFKLNYAPRDLWSDVFIETWDHPPSWSSMHRPGIASVRGDRIILDGTTIDEVNRYHRDTLVQCVNVANQKISEYLERERLKRQRENLAQDAHLKHVQDMADQIKF